jgi:amidase
MSLKDQFDIEGLDSTLGYVGRAFAPATSNAVIVDVLKSLGAVVIAKTNLPQSIMVRPQYLCTAAAIDFLQWCETENPLWGLTTHPMNPAFTSGGSSGGEAALLSSHGSLVGWGTDIGGSIRIPSHMNGLWGLKPSVGYSASGLIKGNADNSHFRAVGCRIKACQSRLMVSSMFLLPLGRWRGRFPLSPL